MKKRNTSIIKELVVSPVAIAILIFIFIIIARSVFTVLSKNNDVRRETARTKERYEELQKQYEELEQSYEYVSTPEGLETEIRNKFFVVKPNEHLIVVTDTQNSEFEDISPENKKKPWWKRIF
jgi:uncharacterized membrane protein YhiD involved in acid resistance